MSSKAPCLSIPVNPDLTTSTIPPPLIPKHSGGSTSTSKHFSRAPSSSRGAAASPAGGLLCLSASSAETLRCSVGCVAPSPASRPAPVEAGVSSAGVAGSGGGGVMPAVEGGNVASCRNGRHLAAGLSILALIVVGKRFTVYRSGCTAGQS